MLVRWGLSSPPRYFARCRRSFWRMVSDHWKMIPKSPERSYRSIKITPGNVINTVLTDDFATRLLQARLRSVSVLIWYMEPALKRFSEVKLTSGPNCPSTPGYVWRTVLIEFNELMILLWVGWYRFRESWGLVCAVYDVCKRYDAFWSVSRIIIPLLIPIYLLSSLLTITLNPNHWRNMYSV